MSADVSDPAPRRRDPRRARTRAALVDAGRRLLAAGRSAASIQEITAEAGVGFGSFYNHFDSKDELFTEAVAGTLDTWGEMRDRLVDGIDDPAEVFATSYRMIGRIQRSLPVHVRLLLKQGTSVLLADRGLRPRAYRDLERGIDSGQFSVPDAEMALMMVGSALLGLIALLDADPDLNEERVADDYTRHVLLMLGVDAVEAQRLVCLPLPTIELPD